MPEHRFSAFFVEFSDAEGLDVGLAVEAQFSFHCKLHGQAVAVPPGLAGDVIALHGAVAGI